MKECTIFYLNFIRKTTYSHYVFFARAPLSFPVYHALKKSCGHVILSAAKNPRLPTSLSWLPWILRCAQNDMST